MRLRSRCRGSRLLSVDFDDRVSRFIARVNLSERFKKRLSKQLDARLFENTIVRLEDLTLGSMCDWLDLSNYEQLQRLRRRV